MSGQDKSRIYKTLNECVKALTTEMMTGQTAHYVTIDRGVYNTLLKEIAEVKKLLVKPDDTIYDG